MIPRVKICGITNGEDAFMAAEAGADALGFIFYDKSPRSIAPREAARIIRRLPPFVTPVGVFVNAPRTVIASVIGETGIRAIQLSGDEFPADCLGHAVSVIKAVRIRSAADALSLIQAFNVDALLLDGATGQQYGGSGRMADLSVAREIAKRHLLILAGGLGPETICDAVRAVEPYAVDVNSGIETHPGKKDPARLQLLFERLRALEPSLVAGGEGGGGARTTRIQHSDRP